MRARERERELKKLHMVLKLFLKEEQQQQGRKGGLFFESKPRYGREYISCDVRGNFITWSRPI